LSSSRAHIAGRTIPGRVAQEILELQSEHLDLSVSEHVTPPRVGLEQALAAVDRKDPIRGGLDQEAIVGGAALQGLFRALALDRDAGERRAARSMSSISSGVGSCVSEA
jgi:hypothetical protein